MSVDFHSRLRAAARSMELQLSDPQIASLLTYLEQLQKWNRTYNLTAIRDPEQMMIHHLFDSLAVVRPIEQILYKNTVSPVLVDVGSGGGLPGVVLAIMCPDASVHCVDTVEKKATFIRYAGGALGLSNLHAHHARIEELSAFNADIVVSRAFASLQDFATLAGKHVAQGGSLLSMKGREPKEEIAALQESTLWRVARIDPINVPELDAQRCLVWMTNEESYE